MKLKPFTVENAKMGFSSVKFLVETILFLILTIQFFQGCCENVYFTYLTLVLSYSCNIIFLFGILYKYMASMNEDSIYLEQMEIVSFYDSYIGSILIPMIFLFNVDNVIFKSVNGKYIELLKQILIIASFVSVVFNRYILRRARKYSQRIAVDDIYKNSETGKFDFDMIILLNGFNMELIFVLFCLFWYIATHFSWANQLLGEATVAFSFVLTACMMIYVGVEDKKRIRLMISIIIAIIVILYYIVKIFL